LFAFNSNNCSKRLSVSLFLRGVLISDPDENNLSTGADDGTVAFSFRNRYFTVGNWCRTSSDSSHGSSKKRKHSILTLFNAISWLFCGSSKSKKSSFIANCADAEVQAGVSVVALSAATALHSKDSLRKYFIKVFC
jgi:hypothetical protein